MKRQRSSSGAKTFQRQSWQFQRSWLAQISQPRWEYARSGAAERRRCIGRNDNVIGWIRIFPFWVVDPERLRCRAEPCKEKRGTPFSLRTLTRFREGGLNTSSFRGSVAAVMNLDRMSKCSGNHRVFDAVTMRSDTEGVSEAVRP